MFLAFLSSSFLWSLLELLPPYLLLLLLPCLFLFLLLETFPSPLWLKPTATQLMALTGPPACCKWVHVSPDEQFLLPVFITWLFTWGSIVLHYLQRQRLCFCCSEQSQAADRHVRSHCTDKRQPCWQLSAYKLPERVQRKWEVLVETKFVYYNLLLAYLLKKCAL